MKKDNNLTPTCGFPERFSVTEMDDLWFSEKLNWFAQIEAAWTISGATGTEKRKYLTQRN